MTRINLIEPSKLHTKHLVAEYRELPRIYALVLNAQSKGLKPEMVGIPDQFCLGAGHVKFFYDKLTWVTHRFYLLVDECVARGFKISHLDPPPIRDRIHPRWYNDWTPTDSDIKLSAERIASKLPKEKT